MSLQRARSSSITSQGSASGPQRSSSRGSFGSLPPPPAGMTSQRSQSSNSQYASSIAKSMTIDEMRMLHDRATREAEAKRTELRLVLASRYRELVGSSDEVIKMNERSQELYDLVHGLPSLFEKLSTIAGSKFNEPSQEDQKEQEADGTEVISRVQRDLSSLPRAIHRALDANNVLEATSKLIEVFTLIASCSDEYPLANSLSDPEKRMQLKNVDNSLKCQAQMIFLHMETLPRKIQRSATRNLLRASSYGSYVADPTFGAYQSATSLLSMDLLDIKKHPDRASHLLDLYFESKTKLLVSLLNRLQIPPQEETTVTDQASQSDRVLTKIVLILQYDALVHPYQIFVLKRCPTKDLDPASMNKIAELLPNFDPIAVRTKCSNFMATHLPLIRKRVKSVLISIAGTTASALGHIRQSLYDKTDGALVMERLSNNGICTWEEAVKDMIDTRAVFGSADSTSNQKFSLWNALFSSTFSSLVNSLLTTSFQSVHSRVVATLRTSLANAPPAAFLLPHEAYRNTLKIATDLDKSLMKVSDDAHELLVHAEERAESERRLKESLYVQACEILGRLISELRRLVKSGGEGAGAKKELIVGRLCYLLKFRLSALPKLLDFNSSPASMQTRTGMISYVNIQSAFEISDDNEDGVISFEEALQAVESAFSGTPFRGAEVIRETLLLSGKDDGGVDMPDSPDDVTLDELVLLSARGLRHEISGPESALGAFQRSLDKIIDNCFAKWAKISLKPDSEYVSEKTRDIFLVTAQLGEVEWQRMFFRRVDEVSESDAEAMLPRPITPSLAGFFFAASSALSCNTCPADSFQQVSSNEELTRLGIESPSDTAFPTLQATLRWAVLYETLHVMTSHLHELLSSMEGLDDACFPAIVHLHADAKFVYKIFYERRNHIGSLLQLEKGLDLSQQKQKLENLLFVVGNWIKKGNRPSVADTLQSHALEGQTRVLDSSDLFFASMFGDTDTHVSAAGEIMSSGTTRPEPLIHMPLSSSRRFNLLPVAADRTLNEIQLRGKYAKESEQPAKNQETTSSNVVSSGFGFLSSMLKNR